MKPVSVGMAAAFALSTAAGQAAGLRSFAVSGSNGGPAFLPTGQYLTATAAPGSTYQRLATGLRPDGNADADDAVSTALSPDGKTLLVLTTGFNTSINYQSSTYQPILFPVLSPITGLPSAFKNPYTGQYAQGYNQAEFVFVYDVTSGVPKKLQQIPIPDTFEGLAWDPSGTRFFVSGGIDDRVLIFKNSGAAAVSYVPDAPFVILNHNSADYQPIPNYDGGLLAGTPAGKAVPALVTGAIAGGLDVSKDGKTMVVANFGNASASIVDLSKPHRPVTNEVVFYHPGSLIPEGEYPYAVAVLSNPTTGAYAKAYVTSQRDDQVMVMTGATLTKYINVPSGPNKMALSANGSTLFVVCGNDDSVVAIDTATDLVLYKISLSRPGSPFKGANPDDVAIGGPNGSQLYVTLGGENAVAVVDLGSRSVVGRIPVGWYPTSTRPSLDGSHLYVINEKSNVGPNPGQTYYSWNTPYGISLNKTNSNTYTWEGEKAGLVSMPTPTGSELAHLTRQVDINDNFGTANDSSEMAFLRTKIKHVIYIVNENRTYDQVLGDLAVPGANGDAKLTFFTQPITPNLHALEADYATLDNFYDSSETSGVGWNWVMQGHTNAFVEETQPVDYGNSNGYGFTYDWQGIVKHMNLGLPPTGGSTIFTTRITGILDPSGNSTILPGHRDPSASVGADDLKSGTIGGYIWEDALRAGLTARNYGWNCDLTYYGTKPFGPPEVRYPFQSRTLQSAPSTPTIQGITDRYYRAFDESYPDIYRIEEWQREFAGFVANNDMPNLMVMTIPHDHTGSFSTALAGLNTPQLELADHDYAIGQLVQTLSHSKYWGSTAIVMLEDDPQDGQDHVEAHRSIIHIISPWTLSHSLIHTTYTSVNALRTVETLLGLAPLGETDANAAPMSDVFGRAPNLEAYNAIIPGSLCASPVDPTLVPACSKPSAARTHRVAQLHDGAWWAAHTTGMNFNEPDHIDSRYYNALLEYGITGHGKVPPRSAVAITAGDGD
jgi:YVTN family beta-propeller protein